MGSGFVIRDAGSTDIDALARLETERFASDRLSRRSLRSLMRSPSACLLVATRGEDPVGYAVLLMRRGSHTARLYSIAVGAEATGRGVGSRLLSAMEEVARQRGADRLRLEVRADDPTVAGFYERAGYQPTGHRPGYYEDGMGALLLSRNLSNG